MALLRAVASGLAMRRAWNDDFGDESKVNPPVLESFGVILHGDVVKQFPGVPCWRHRNPFTSPDVVLSPICKAQRERLEWLSLPCTLDRFGRGHCLDLWCGFGAVKLRHSAFAKRKI